MNAFKWGVLPPLRWRQYAMTLVMILYNFVKSKFCTWAVHTSS